MRRTSFACSVLLALSLLCVGCKQRPGQAPPCNAVAAAVVTQARVEIAAAKLSPADAHMATDQLSPLGDALASACDRDNWSPEARTCLAGAATVAAATACQSLLTDAQRLALSKAAKK
ncbi:MAG: hypothetical protein KBG15_21325 [Kofleriaceae bacterium]|nr:hypothetical protein [Kofleriaceae bacterium]